MEGLELQLKIVGQALFALLLGGILGWEREKAGKTAGLRTYMLVCCSATLFMRLGELLILHTARLLNGDGFRADPAHLIVAIATGVAFIGAGTVLRDPRRNVAHGLTTAAGLLALIPIGIAVAIDLYIAAAGLTLMVFIVLRVISRFENPLHASAAVPDPKQDSKR